MVFMNGLISHPVMTFRDYQFRIPLRVGFGLLVVLSMAYMVVAPYQGLGQLGWMVVLGAIGLGVWAMVQAVFIDFFAQLLGRPAAARRCFLSLTLMMWPYLLLLPINLLTSAMESSYIYSWLSLVVWLWVIALKLRCLTIIYSISTGQALMLLVSPIGCFITFVGLMIMSLGFLFGNV